MQEPVPQPPSVAAFLAWPERPAELYEPVDGEPVRVTAGARDAHADDLSDGVAFPARPRIVRAEPPA